VRERLGGEIPIAMDETAREPDAIASGACDFVCLKIARSGGITGLWAAAHAARDAGSQPYVASTYDGPIGIAAGLHAAAALGPDIPACGLATLPLFEGVDDPFPARDGRITVPSGPGLGVTWPVG
jgi:L-alanine-DL-glutamate epimerase-like enolase superfamily enzyme